MRSTNTENFCHDLRVKMTLGPRKTPERQRRDNGRRGISPPFPPPPPSKGKTHCLPTRRFPGMEPGRRAGGNTMKNTEGARGTPANVPVWTSTRPVHATKIFHEAWNREMGFDEHPQTYPQTMHGIVGVLEGRDDGIQTQWPVQMHNACRHVVFLYKLKANHLCIAHLAMVVTKAVGQETTRAVRKVGRQETARAGTDVSSSSR